MTSPLSHEAVAQMVADLTEADKPLMYGIIPFSETRRRIRTAADMLTTLATENATLRAENEELDFLRHEGGPDSVAAMEIELATLRAERDAWTKIDVARDVDFATLRASEAAALERVTELEAAACSYQAALLKHGIDGSKGPKE